MDGNVHYLGSLFRNCFGEETPKGYGIISDDKLDFIENKEAYIFKTYEFNEDSDVYKSLDELIKAIDDIKEQNPEIFRGVHYGKIRLVFHCPASCDIDIKGHLKTLGPHNKEFTTLIEESNDDVMEEVGDDIADEYEFILDNSMKLTDKIHLFITKHYDEPMSLDELIDYISKPLEV